MDSTTTFETDLAELKRVRKLQRVLEAPAYLYESRAAACVGDCENPRVIVEQDGKGITCCAFKIAYDLVNDARVLERDLRKRIERAADTAMARSAARQHRREAISGLHLSKALPRDFTGTAAARKKAIVQNTDQEVIMKAMEALHGDT